MSEPAKVCCEDCYWWEGDPEDKDPEREGFCFYTMPLPEKNGYLEKVMARDRCHHHSDIESVMTRGQYEEWLKRTMAEIRGMERTAHDTETN